MENSVNFENERLWQPWIEPYIAKFVYVADTELQWLQ